MNKQFYLVLAAFSAVIFSASSFPHTAQHGSAAASQVGKPGDPKKAKQVIEVLTSDDMRFQFKQNLDLSDGDIVTFKVTNSGNVAHEFSIGDEAEQKAHQKMMEKMPNMVHEDGNTITVKPGETKTITWQFKAGDDVVISCNIPGHYQAGMYKKVKVKTQ